MPNNITATIKIGKLDSRSANTARNNAKTADMDAIAHPLRRPIFFISIVAGIVVAATASTIIDSGKVANALFAVNSDPIIPASITITIDPDVDIN